MSGFLEVVRAAGSAHEAAVTCVTGSDGQPVCTSVSAGAFAGLGVVILIYVGILVVTVLAYVKIISKAGYSGWWVLIGLVPIANVVFFLIFAFAEWPILQELRMRRLQPGGGPGFGRPLGYGSPPGGGPAPGGWGSAPPGMPPAGQTPPSQTPPGQTPPAGTTESTMEQMDIPSFGEVMRGSAGIGPAGAAGSEVAASPAGPAAVQPGAARPTPGIAGSGPPAAGPGSGPPAGWFPAPGGPGGRLRYWDGSVWTEHYH